MKKTSLYLIVILCVLCTGCTKKTINLQEYEISLHKDEVYQISAPRMSHYNYQSLNKFHATVSSEGLIVGHYVGETDIVVSNDYDEKRIHVTIEPTYLLYNEPQITFGESRNAIKARFGTPYQENNNAALFEYDREGFALMVTFDQNDRVVSYVVVVPNRYLSDLALFLYERYQSNGSSGSYTHYYINALTENEATLFVTLLPYNADLWFVMYEPFNRNEKFMVHTPSIDHETKSALEALPW